MPTHSPAKPTSTPTRPESARLQRRQALAAGAALGAWAAIAPAGALAQAVARPIRLVVPYPPGGPLDTVARALAQAVHESLGVVVVDNKPGAAATSAPTSSRNRRPTGSPF